MILHVVAIKDRAADAFNNPFYTPAIGQAMRAFQDEVNNNREGNAMHAHPDDFDLYLLGTYDNNTGITTNNEGGPKQIAIGKQMITA